MAGALVRLSLLLLSVAAVARGASEAAAGLLGARRLADAGALPCTWAVGGVCLANPEFVQQAAAKLACTTPLSRDSLPKLCGLQPAASCPTEGCSVKPVWRPVGNVCQQTDLCTTTFASPTTAPPTVAPGSCTALTDDSIGRDSIVRCQQKGVSTPQALSDCLIKEFYWPATCRTQSTSEACARFGVCDWNSDGGCCRVNVARMQAEMPPVPSCVDGFSQLQGLSYNCTTAILTGNLSACTGDCELLPKQQCLAVPSPTVPVQVTLPLCLPSAAKVKSVISAYPDIQPYYELSVVYLTCDAARTQAECECVSLKTQQPRCVSAGFGLVTSRAWWLLAVLSFAGAF